MSEEELEQEKQESYELGEIQGVQWGAAQIMNYAVEEFRKGSRQTADQLRALSNVLSVHATQLRQEYDDKYHAEIKS